MNKQYLRTHFLEFLFCHLLIVFLIGRVGFMVYNRHIESLSFLEALSALKNGLLAHDLVVAAIILLFPLLMLWIAFRRPSMRLRRWLAPYYVVVGILVGIIIMADIVMYEYWQFKLGAVVLSYAASPEGVTNSVPFSYIFIRVLGGVGLMILTAIPCIYLTPQKVDNDRGTRVWAQYVTLILLFFSIAGVSFTHVGDAYGEKKSLFLNHAAVNPVYHFAASFHLGKKPYAQYAYVSPAEEDHVVETCYPRDTEDITDTLLHTSRPSILLVMLESFGGKFVKELGGIPEVAPQWSRLIPEGIFWDQYYSNSFRTDRGIVSTLSGQVSLPRESLSRDTTTHSRLSSLIRSLHGAGYRSYYLYAGKMTNMGKRQYLENMDFQHLLDDTAFTPEELNSSWGANDSTAAMKIFETIKSQKEDNWFMVFQALSSHEPWDVPYHRLDDKVLNAFAYTDHCLGMLVDSLKTLSQWENMLVIVLPDHGFLYEQNYEDPEFFHSPLLWLGGAIKEPRRMSVLMNQSDLAATLLSQMGLSHESYQWSRNVLSRHYTYPCVYCNFPTGIMFKDSTGVSIFDISADKLLLESPSDGDLRTYKAKAILQRSQLILKP